MSVSRDMADIWLSVVSKAEEDPGKKMVLDAAGMSSSNSQEESRPAAHIGWLWLRRWRAWL